MSINSLGNKSVILNISASFNEMRNVPVHCCLKELLSFCLSFAEPECGMLSDRPFINWQKYLLSIFSKHSARSVGSTVNDEMRGHEGETRVIANYKVCDLTWYFLFMGITHFKLIPPLKTIEICIRAPCSLYWSLV